MNALIVTLLHKQFGPAIASWMYARRVWIDSDPSLRFAHMEIAGTPAKASGAVGHDVVTVKYQEAQDIFLAGDWDVLITLEDDMIIPSDGFVKLMALLDNGADIGYGLYAFRHGTPQWSCFLSLFDERGHCLSKATPSLVNHLFGTVVDVAGVGLGFTAIKRHVLEQIRWQRRGNACNDWYMALDANKLGFVQRMDLSLVCGHMQVMPTPRVFYPDPDAEGFVRVDLLDVRAEDMERPHDS